MGSHCVFKSWVCWAIGLESDVGCDPNWCGEWHPNVRERERERV